jgi:hypothetical protein
MAPLLREPPVGATDPSQYGSERGPECWRKEEDGAGCVGSAIWQMFFGSRLERFAESESNPIGRITP